MQLDIKKDDTFVYTEEKNPHTSFRIAMNAKAFSVLSDSLYKNKIGSLVRELSSNAYDSHIQAKKTETPFEIHTPDKFEPWFSVKDFGIGLSDVEIVQIYTSFFESTKDSSNETLGAFGLGSKSWYSYCSSGSITSIKDGIKNHYSAYLQDGIPTISRLLSEPTEEANGVEVKIGVKQQDFSKFAEEIRLQLRFFPVKPNVINGRIEFDNTFDKTNPELMFNTNSIRVQQRSNSRYSSYDSSYNEFFIVLGVVGYPLEVSNLGSKLTPKHKTFLNCIRGNAAFIFNIGEIEVTASREGISYKEKTIDAIIAKIEAAEEEIYQLMEAKISHITNGWERACAINGFNNLTPIFINKSGKSQSTDYHNEKFAFDIHTINLVDKDNRRTYVLNQYGSTSVASFSRKSSDIRTLIADDKAIFFVRDTHKKPVAKMKEFYSNNGGKQVFVFEHTGINLVEPFFTDTDIQEISKCLGDVPVQKVSELPDPVRVNVGSDGKVRTGRTGSVNAKGYMIQSLTRCNTFSGGTRVTDNNASKVYGELDEIEPGIFIKMEESAVINPFLKFTGITNDYMLAILTQIGQINNHLDKDTPSVYFFSPKNYEKISKMDGWVTPEMFIEQTLVEYKEIEKNIETLARYKNIQKYISEQVGYHSDSYLSALSTKDYVKKLNKNSNGSYFIRVNYALNQKITKYSKYDSVLHIFTRLVKNSGTVVDNSAVEEKLTNSINSVILMKHLSSMNYHSEAKPEVIEHLVKYINLVS